MEWGAGEGNGGVVQSFEWPSGHTLKELFKGVAQTGSPNVSNGWRDAGGTLVHVAPFRFGRDLAVPRVAPARNL